MPEPAFWQDALNKAAVQFNTKQFWECHETLEAVWLTAPEPDKTFLQGLIQLAAACHHVTRRNQKGALSLFSQGLEKLSRVQETERFEKAVLLNKFLSEITQLQQQVKTGTYPELFPTMHSTGGFQTHPYEG